LYGYKACLIKNEIFKINEIKYYILARFTLSVFGIWDLTGVSECPVQTAIYS